MKMVTHALLILLGIIGLANSEIINHTTIKNLVVSLILNLCLIYIEYRFHAVIIPKFVWQATDMVMKHWRTTFLKSI